MMEPCTQPWILVRGGGDIATGTILRLYRCGFRVLVTECRNPSAIRRRAALCEAVWTGRAEVEGAVCRRIEAPEEAEAVFRSGEIPLLVDEHLDCLEKIRPAAVIDAILAKKNLGTRRSMAPITVGLGPGFTAGEDVDAVIETMRGYRLGRVILEGSAIPNTGVPGFIGGFAAERVIHSPASGPMVFLDGLDIGARVEKGQVLAYVGSTPIHATLTGVLRGLIREGYPVIRGLKIADIDPRPDQAAYCATVSDKALAIGGGCLEALLGLSRQKKISLL